MTIAGTMIMAGLIGLAILFMLAVGIVWVEARFIKR